MPQSQAKTKTSPRRLKPAEYKRFRYSKRIKRPSKPLPSGRQLFSQSFQILWQHKRFFATVLVTYGLLTIVLVQGLNGGLNVTSLKHGLKGNGPPLANGFTLFGLLLSSLAATSSASGSVYQSLLLVIISLALIWGLRQAYGSHTKQPLQLTARQAFYQGMYPLVPFFLVLIVISLQLIPFVVGGSVYSTVNNNGLAISPAERAVWAAFFFVLAIWTLYMLAASVFALYIVTLPNMKPIESLRSARKLVRYRRWTILRKLLFLPVSLLVVGLIVMLPLLLWLTVVAQWAFFALSLVSLAVINAYMYNLYRALL